MRSNRTASGALGILLLVAGGILLLQNLGVAGPIVSSTIWTLLFALGGLAFLLVFLLDRENWWALIPGLTLMGLTVLVGFGDQLGALGAAIFLSFIGLSFLLIYVLHRDFWWALIPAGSLFSVAAMVAVSDRAGGEAALGVMFFGLALTFALVYLLPGRAEERRWALIPAGILAVIGLLMMLTLGALINYLGAVALIAVGVWILARTVRARR